MQKSLVPEDLRAALFYTVEKQDERTFVSLCRQYQAAILENYHTWARVPEQVRGDPAAVQRWANALITLANFFMAQGIPDLMDIISGKGKSNPTVRWQDGMMEAQRLSDAGQYAQSITVVQTILEEMKGASGTFIDVNRPKMYGLLGVNFFKLGDLEAAKSYTSQALDECERTGDDEGAGIYRENLSSTMTALAARFEGAAGKKEFNLRQEIARAQDLADGLNYQASTTLLNEAMLRYDPPILNAYLPKILGLLGSNHYYSGDLVAAQTLTRRALEASQANQDQNGTCIYKANLDVITKRLEKQNAPGGS